MSPTVPPAGLGLTGRPVDWLLGVPDVASRLRRQPPARVLVLGSGEGVDAIDLALAFPNVTVYGVDDDAAAVERAEAAGLRSHARDRLLFLVGDVLEPRVRVSPDLVVAAGVLTDPSRTDGPGVMTLLAGLARLLPADGLAVLDSPVDLQRSTVAAAGFTGGLEAVGLSAHACPAYLLRR
jgi:SAM-dependent methyltransferase